MTVLHGDCREQLRSLPDASVDAVVTDPPYEINMMSKAWDRTGVAFDPALWAEVHRVLKPGGWVLCFGGTRTYHRVTCAIEDAGLDIRDSVAAWMYAQGWPKGQGQLKPAWEPVVVARKAAPRPVLQIDACRVATTDDLNGGAYSGEKRLRSGFTPTDSAVGAVVGNRLRNGLGEYTPPPGRWPTNTVFCHHPECGADTCHDDCWVAELDRQSGSKVGAHGGRGMYRQHTWLNGETPQDIARSEGSASRFFPTFRYQPKARQSERPVVDGVKHGTVKPLALMRWLVRLVTPPDGTVLDPFLGSGTTAEACELEGLRWVGCERDASYLPLIEQRLARVVQPPLLMDVSA